MKDININMFNWLWWALAGILLSLLPLFVPTYYIYLMTEILILGLFAMSFNLLFGYTGMLSFGQGAFFGIGAYSAGLVLKHAYQCVFLSIIVAMACALILAIIIGFFCVRLTGLYFAMLTLAFGQMIFGLVFKWREVTGGDDGLVGIPRPPLNLFGWEISLSGPDKFYYFTLIVVALAVWLIKALVNSPIGQIFQAIRENVERTNFLGLNVRFYQIVSFSLAGMIAGLAGAMYAQFNGIVDPSQVQWTNSANAVMVSLIGGTSFFPGPLIGAGLFMILKEIILSFTEYWMIFLGSLLVLIVIYLPGGCAGYLHERFLNRRPNG